MLPTESRQPEKVPALLARDVSKRYGPRGVWALRGVSLTVPAGGVVALVGPNGAGKSTLIRSWVGFERPTRGIVEVQGLDPWRRRSEALSHIGYVPQGTAFYRSLTVDEHVELAKALRGGRLDAKLVRARLRSLGIPLRQPARQLSGGQQSQLSLAIALGTGAQVLVLDEPLASLDPLARREFMSVLTDAVRRDGRTAILSSHVVTDVETACDRIAILADGLILLDLEIADALMSHRLQSEGAIGPRERAVATFGSISGPSETLVHGGPYGADERASLESVVIGYLAASRAAADTDPLLSQG